MSRRTDELRSIVYEAAKSGRIVIAGHDRADVDSAASCVLLARLLSAWQIPSTVILFDPDKQSQRVMRRFSVDVSSMKGETTQQDRLFLVDHHQTEHEGCVIACIDHHPTDYPPDYPYLHIEESGACAAIILRLMKEAGIDVTMEDERLAVTALYLDTIALKSAKITKEEASWGERQAKRLGLDEKWLRQEGMGLRDMSLPTYDLAMLGKKAYRFGDHLVLSTYVQTDAMTKEKLNEILSVLDQEMRRENAALWVYLVHDPVHMQSTEYDLTPDGRIEEIRYGFLASRGKDVMPRVERMMRKAGMEDGGNAQ